MKRNLIKLLFLTTALCALLTLTAFAAEGESAIGGTEGELRWSTDEVELFQEGSFDAEFTMPGNDAIMMIDDDDTTAQETTLYNLILAGLQARTSPIDVSEAEIDWDASEAVMESVFGRVVNDHPELYYVNKSFSYSGKYISAGSSTIIVSTLTVTYKEGYDNEKFDGEIAAALAQVNNNMTDLEKALVLHDYLANLVTYNWEVATNSDESYSNDVYNAYGAFVNHDAVCQGYAMAYKLLLDEVGINCVMETSTSMNHAWNLVQIDGYWYHVDVTWDDPTPDVPGKVEHAYFLLSDDTIQTTSDSRNAAHTGYDVTDFCVSPLYESGYAFNDADSAFYLWNGSYYYVAQVANNYEGAYLYQVDSFLQNGTQLTTLSGRWLSGTIWTDGALYYPSQSSNILQIKRCDLSTQTITAVGDSVAYERAGYDKYTSGSDFVGLRLNENGQIEAVSSTRRSVLLTVDIPLYPDDWESATLESGETAKFLGVTTKETQITAGILLGNPTTATVWAGFYNGGKMVGIQSASLQAEAGINTVQLDGTDLPTWTEIRLFLTDPTTYAPYCGKGVFPNSNN